MEQEGHYILIVDDEPHITSALRRELGPWVRERSLEILTANSAPEALALLSESGDRTVIVISDLRMPEMKGSDFLMEVKAKYPRIVSILLTGYAEVEEIMKSVGAGMFSFMLKPWDSRYLLAELQRAYDHAETVRQNEAYHRLLEEELKWAGQMQRTLLKPTLPRSEGVEFRASYRPAPGLYCGGDYYDAIFLGTERYLILIGEVSGHNVRAAFVTGILKAIIYPEYVRAVVGRSFSPNALLSWLNDRLQFELRGAAEEGITLLAGVLDLKAGTFVYANAGHAHPFLVSDGCATELPVSGRALGFAHSLSCAEQLINVHKDDLLFLFSDGLSPSGDGGGANMKDVLESVKSGDDYHRRVMDAALAASGAKEFVDNVTLLTAKIL